jgi:hypothetical protein
MNFRRQFVFRLLVYFQHLITFTKTAKSLWFNSQHKERNRAQRPRVRGICRCDPRAGEELGEMEERVLLVNRQGGVDGREVGIEEATKEKRRELMVDRFGSASLSGTWEMWYKDLPDLQHPLQFVPSLPFVAHVLTLNTALKTSKALGKKVKLEDLRIDMRKKQLAVGGTELPPDDAVIAKHEAPKQCWNWLALCRARDTHLQQFGKIGSGVVQLEVKIDKERLDVIAAKEKSGGEEGGELSAEDIGNEGDAGDLKAPPDPPRDGDGVRSGSRCARFLLRNAVQLSLRQLTFRGVRQRNMAGAANNTLHILALVNYCTWHIH